MAFNSVVPGSTFPRPFELTEAVDRALRQKEDVQKAMYRKEVGQIDFVWGTPGKIQPDAQGQTH